MQPKSLDWLSDQLVFINVDITNWSGKKSLTPEDLGLDRSQLPPETLVSLGDKQLIDPEALKAFGSIRGAARRLCLAVGTRFLGGHAVPVAKAPALLAELDALGQRYRDARAAFLAGYDAQLAAWTRQQPPEWQKLIRDALVPAEYVGGRLSFAVQAVRFAAPDPEVVNHDGLNQALSGLGDQVFHEVGQLAREALERSFQGKDAVTRRALGQGDATGVYGGVQRMNGALLDRFWVVEVDYPEPAEEAEIVARAVPTLPTEIVHKMIEVANEVRTLFVGRPFGCGHGGSHLLHPHPGAVGLPHPPVQGGAPTPPPRPETGADRPGRAGNGRGHPRHRPADLRGESVMAAPAMTVRLYRMTRPDGTSKDWAVPTALDPRGLTVYFGRTGSTLRQAETPAGQCRDGIPIREAEVRVREKVAKGYQALGTFRLAANRRDLTPESACQDDAGNGRDASDPSAASSPKAIPALYWRLHAPATVTGTRFETAVQDTNERLATVGWRLPGSRPDDAGRALWLRMAMFARRRRCRPMAWCR